MDNKTKDALKQLQAEIRQLQSALTDRKADGPPTEDDSGLRKEKNAKEAAVLCEIQHPFPGETGEIKRWTTTATSIQLSRVSHEAAAALGYALASPQKVALLRALLAQESESAPALGAVTGLTTGSLYHHLRELMRADLVRQSGRNCYVLTEYGLRVLLVLLTLAVK